MSSRLINIYDFDHTIYDGDCTLDFYFYCIKRRPLLALTALKPILAACLFLLKIKNREYFKEAFYTSFLPRVTAAELLPDFWNAHLHKMKPFYIKQKKDSDLIISASPRFIVQYAADYLGVRLIASEVDQETGRLLSKNCRGEQKVTMLYESKILKTNDKIHSFYSDSLSDAPLAALAEKKFIVHKEIIKESDFAQSSRSSFLTLDFVRFVIIGGVNVLVGVSASAAFSLFVHPSAAFVLGYAASLIIGFFLMSFVVFSSTIFTIPQFIKYCLGYIPNFTIQAVIITLLYNILDVYHIVAYCVAAIVAVPTTFLVMRLKVFKNKK